MVNSLEYEVGSTRLWEHAEGYDSSSSNDDTFVSQKDDLFALREYFDTEENRRIAAPDATYDILGAVFGQDRLGCFNEFLISAHRIRRENPFAHTHYLFFKFKDIKLPISAHQQNGQTYIHVLSTLQGQITTLRCFSLKTSLNGSALISFFNELANKTNESETESELIESINQMNGINGDFRVRWNCIPPGFPPSDP